MEVSSQLHPPAALPPCKSLRYTLAGRLGGPQSRSGRGDGGGKYHHCSCLELTPVVQSVA